MVPRAIPWNRSRGVGDYLRAITTPQRKLSGEEGEEGAVKKGHVFPFLGGRNG